MNQINHTEIGELQAEFSPLFKIMCRRYLYYQLGADSSNQDGLARAMIRYLKELEFANIPAKCIKEHALDILNKPRYASKPPAPRELAILLQRSQENESPEITALNELFDDLKTKYRNLWHSQEDRGVIIRKWLADARRFNLGAEGVAKVARIVGHEAAYSRFPPSEMEMRILFGIASLKENVTLPCHAYDAATKGDPCKVVRFARSEFGALKLIKRTDTWVRKEFEEAYCNTLLRYLDGEIEIESQKANSNPDSKDDTSPLMSKEEILNLVAGDGK